MSQACFDDYLVSPSPLPNDGYVFVDHSVNNRSGHLGHALVECINGDILAFFPNCNDDNHGHSGNGWMEYKRSSDGGASWSEPQKLDYSYNMWKACCGKTAMAEKAVCTDDGTIVLFNLICDMQTNGSIWEPYLVPTFIRSFDNGNTWSEAQSLVNSRGRIYDALYKNGRIYVLFFSNDATEHYAGVNEEHKYQLFISDDNGRSFSHRSDLSIDAHGRCYGTMEFLQDGSLIVYTYDINDEKHPDYCISRDNGASWLNPQKAYVAKQIRNPQVVRFGDGYFMHGRSGSLGEEELQNHFVIYWSKDCIHWDEGHYLRMKGPGPGGYSNNLVIGKHNSNSPTRLLIHTSHPYQEARTNIIYWWIDTHK